MARSPAAATPAARVPAARIVCWQLALVLAAVAVTRPWPYATGLGTASAVLVGLTAVRVRGEWLSTRLRRRAGWLLRRRAYLLPPAGGTAPEALLPALLPGARLVTAQFGGELAGLVSQPGALVAVLRPAADRPGSTGTESLGSSSPAGTDSVADLIRAAFSGTLLTEHAPDQQPQLELDLILHRGPQQARLRAWLAVRARRDADAADDELLRVALGNTARRMLRRARRSGLDLTLLPERELLATVRALTHTGPGREALRERWRYWQAGPVTQIGMRLRGTGTGLLDRASVLHRVFAQVPDVALTAAVSAHSPGLAGVLRIATTSAEHADAAAAQLALLGPDHGVRLERLDGLHRRAVAASLPIGAPMPIGETQP
ncbi:hypothetical protein [Micromonospora musae]|uniref:hypothetical protein n=1 Tax=Micromonospora musae TaxID=1894970 RepID=UPI0033ED1774